MGTTGRDGKRYNMIMVTADAARAWLFSVNQRKVGEHVRTKLV